MMNILYIKKQEQPFFFPEALKRLLHFSFANSLKLQFGDLKRQEVNNSQEINSFTRISVSKISRDKQTECVCTVLRSH